MLVPRARQYLWSQDCYQPCWFPGHGAICGPRIAASHVGSRGMAGAVGLWQRGGHIHSRGIAGAVVPWLHWPCWFPGHWWICGSGAAAGHVGSRAMAGAMGPGLPGGHAFSRVLAGAVGPGLLLAMLVPGA